ncbi:MAG: 16S rRNA (cytosine(967)-C(5))-methyltransferase RsmB [Firmicutes bacterium]|nr:16S rRNA (cytosine(967)-C(5))-methyltransferase RsmB [Bacillota bacterium]
MTSREAAVRVLQKTEKNEAYANSALKEALAKAGLSALDNAFATELVYGVIRHKMRIDYIISHYSSQKLKNLSIWILSILRIGVYQLLFLDSVPSFAAINESVKLAKRYGHAASAGFVNAVLRAVSKGGEIKIPSIEQYYSHPKWLVDMICSQYPNDCKKILAANNTVAPITVRVNTLKTTPQLLCDSFKKSGITATADGEIITISKFGDLSLLEEYKNGLFIPQDKGAYLAAKAVNPKPGQLVIDVCAAPGGKTTQLAQMSDDKAKVIAFDIHPHKISLIERNAERMGIGSVTALVHDAATIKEEYVGTADSVLADVPCSGLGIIRKKPDIKWTKSPSDIEQIIKLQKSILAASAKYLKKDGVLVYSTCTINKHENSDVTDDFIKRHPFEKVWEKQLLPHIDNCDGFYICKLIRRSF